MRNERRSHQERMIIGGVTIAASGLGTLLLAAAYEEFGITPPLPKAVLTLIVLLPLTYAVGYAFTDLSDDVSEWRDS